MNEVWDFKMFKRVILKFVVRGGFGLVLYIDLIVY